MATALGVSGEKTADDSGRRIGRIGGTGLFAVVLAVAAVVSGVLLYSTLMGIAPLGTSQSTIIILILVNLGIVLGLAALVVWRLSRLWLNRRSGLAGARLHGRLVALFSVIAVIPAIIVAGFAAFSLNLGVELWFSQRVQTVLDTALAVSREFVQAHRKTLSLNISRISTELNQAEESFNNQSREYQDLIGRLANLQNLDAVYVINRSGEIFVQTQKGIAFEESGVAETNSQMFIFPEIFAVPRPENSEGQPQDAFALADEGNIVIWDDGKQEFRALKRLDYQNPVYLYAVRFLDPQVIRYLVQTRQAKLEYESADRNQSAIQVFFALSYAVVALLVLLAAIWLGLWAANRIVAPIGRLIGAAERVSEGDLGARVDVSPSDDEVGILGRAFNRMTGQLQSQRNELMEANRQFDQRRRFTEAVLSGVTAGVIGADSEGRVTLANRSALSMLETQEEALVGNLIKEALPEFVVLFEGAQERADGAADGEVDLMRRGEAKNLTVRVTSEISHGETRGFVITFDDITELVSAQRMSAWADIARRIAHEIKNPLTPIQLSAERLKRKYAKEISSDPSVFEQCTDTIIRQVNDIGRMVDEFSSFARMPAPSIGEQNVSEIVRQTVFLQRVASPDINVEHHGLENPIFQQCDGRLLSQALTNVLKNAAEAVSDGALHSSHPTERGRIDVTVRQDKDFTMIEIADNGRGFPSEGRQRLTEPYMTTRQKGTGLGLAIVKKIMEDHGGGLSLHDASTVDGEENAQQGALVRLNFPRDVKEAAARSEKEKGAQVSRYGA
jgi:two-component system nitrogen regulation sensor histidine kinase NtrY